MKRLKTLLCGLLATAMVTGCSDDNLMTDDSTNVNQGTEAESDGYYMSLDMLMPNGRNYSRSYTVEGGGSNDGIEVGNDNENAVGNVLLVLARRSSNPDKNLGYITSAKVNSNHISEMQVAGEKSYKALARVQKTNISLLYEELAATTGVVNPVVYVFAFCNPTADLLDMFAGAKVDYGDTSWVDAVCTVNQGDDDQPDFNTGVWGNRSFLMNNASLTTRALPAKVEDWDNFDKIENPFHLSDNNQIDGVENLPNNSTDIEGRGPLRVERSVARFDFKDGSKNGDQSYDVLYHRHSGTNVETEPLVSVKLLRMAMVNMSRQFYYVPRVSDNGMPDGPNFAICGNEKPWTPDGTNYIQGNYVVGPNADIFEDGDLGGNFQIYFNFPFFDSNGTFNNETMAGHQWDVYEINDVLNGTVKDNYQNKHDYTIWRYVTENVIPGGPEKQVNGITTGIVFKARILSGSYARSESLKTYEADWESDIHENLADCLDGKPFYQHRQLHAPITGYSKNDPILFYYDGTLYMGWDHLRQAAIQASVTKTNAANVEINRSNSLYKAVFGEGAIPPNNVYLTGQGTINGEPIAANQIKIVDPNWNSDPNSDAYKLYMQSADYAFNQWEAAGRPDDVIGGQTPKVLAAMRDAVTASGITIYQSSKGEVNGTPGYYCYYYYWNRHNDNGKNGMMGPMEFDVVRNNVYKLSVDKINRLGHPRVPQNDSDNPTPTTPDESSVIYLDVNVKVTPWAVRINSIEF